MNRTWKFADIPVQATFAEAYLAKQCKAYECSDKPLFSLTVTPEDVAYERSLATDGTAYDDGYLESLAFYRQFATAALDADVLLLHGSAIAFRGRAYLFTAPSGTGKSTHARLCKEAFGDAVSYINDDKPLLRRVDGAWLVYGTPWDGKHHLSANVSVPLGGICLLTRGQTNFIVRIGGTDALTVLMEQAFRPPDADHLRKALQLMLSLGQSPFWRLSCTPFVAAAWTSLGAMTNSDANEKKENDI